MMTTIQYALLTLLVCFILGRVGFYYWYQQLERRAKLEASQPEKPVHSSRQAMRLTQTEVSLLVVAFAELGVVRDSHAHHQRMAEVLGIDDTVAWRLLAVGSTVDPPWVFLKDGFWRPTPMLARQVKEYDEHVRKMARR